MDPIQATIDEVLDELIAFRHDLHAHPELGFDLPRTAGRVADRLATLDGVTVRTGVATSGIVATLNADAPGPCVGLRGDMDALPIAEETGRPYASTTAGRMHACGHDGHTSCLLGAAMVLSRLARCDPPVRRPAGPVRFVFQPAEETDGGGRHMCEQGALDDPSVAAIFALHGWPSMAVGEIGLRAGPAMAASNPFTIRVRGKGGHAAYPQRSIDPILVSARIIDGLQTIASRTATPGDPVVVTVARIQAGTIGNVIPDEAEMEGTIRTVNPSTRELVTESVRRIAERTAEAFGASAEVNLVEGYPSLLNDPGLTDYVATVAGDVFGLDNVSTDLPISMGVEDFAYYAQRVPAVMFRLGLKPPADESFPGLHTSTFDFNDDALPVGIRLFVELALRWNEEAPR